MQKVSEPENKAQRITLTLIAFINKVLEYFVKEWIFFFTRNGMNVTSLLNNIQGES